MLFTRKIGKLLRGKATPAQIMMAAVLGGMIGFIPSFAAAPGLMIALLLLLAVLNANLMVAGLVGLGAKLLSLALMPVSFAIGRFMLDGPTQGLFKWAINAPVLVFFGLEYYVTSGVLLGLLIGAAAGFALVRAVSAFRRKMASLEEGSERYHALVSKRWVKVLVFIFVGGGHGKLTYAQLSQRKVGNPIRPLGLVLVALVAALLFIAQTFASGPIVTAFLRAGLERSNGATVDLGSADLDIKAGRLTMTALAMADPNALDTDLLRARTITADVSGMSLLRKRLALDNVVIDDASHGAARTLPGRRTRRLPELPIPKEGDGKTIEDYIQKGQQWRERLAQVRRWLDRISGADPDEAAPDETLRERLERQVRELGYANVRADHLIEGAPTLLIIDLVINRLTVPQLEGETLDVHAQYLSTHPRLVEQTPHITVTSSAETLDLQLALGSASSQGGENTIVMALRNLSLDNAISKFNAAARPPVQGGTYDLGLNGQWSTASLNLPLSVQLRDATLQLGGKTTSLNNLPLTLGLRGPLDSPRIVVDEKALSDALIKAGADEAARRLRGEADKLTEKATDQLKDKVGDEVGERARGLLDGLRKR